MGRTIEESAAPEPPTPGIRRRKALATLVAGALVIGFDPVSRRWIREADACENDACGRSFPRHGIPSLDGTLHLDMATRQADAKDFGNIVERFPAAVLRPGSTRDVKRMIKFCRERHIHVAARGQHHTMFGQGLTCGLIIETQTLDRIHSIGPDGADVEAGALWTDVVAAALEQGLRPRGLTGYSGLSVGGTLSVGGCPTSNEEGGLVDHVQELTVVTGEGDVVECSDCDHEDLFEAALAGLGQCGIITRAKIDLVPAHPLARTYLIHYADTAAFFADLFELLERGELDEVYSVCLPPGIAPFLYQINATIYYDPSAPPNDAHLLRNLNAPVFPNPVIDRPYFAHVTSVDAQVEALRATVDWDHLVKPWFDVWVPGSEAEAFIGSVIEGLSPGDVGAGGFILLLPQRRSSMNRPLFRVPEPECASDWIILFDVLTTSFVPGPDPAFANAMLARNRAWFDEAEDLGGTRYPIGALEFSRADWKRHYGDEWKRFKKRKRRFDPGGILTPGLGIFGDEDA